MNDELALDYVWRLRDSRSKITTGYLRLSALQKTSCGRSPGKSILENTYTPETSLASGYDSNEERS